MFVVRQQQSAIYQNVWLVPSSRKPTDRDNKFLGEIYEEEKNRSKIATTKLGSRVSPIPNCFLGGLVRSQSWSRASSQLLGSLYSYRCAERPFTFGNKNHESNRRRREGGKRLIKSFSYKMVLLILFPSLSFVLRESFKRGQIKEFVECSSLREKCILFFVWSPASWVISQKQTGSNETKALNGSIFRGGDALLRLRAVSDSGNSFGQIPPPCYPVYLAS